MTTSTLTPVVVATHADNVVRLYYRTADGALNQTGQLVANTIDPTSLATLAADLSDAFGWAPVPVVKAVKAPPKVLDKPKKPKGHTGRTRANPAETARRKGRIVQFLAEHGEATAPDIGLVLFADGRDPEGRARSLLDLMIRDGQVIRGPKIPGHAMKFSLPTRPHIVPDPEPEQTP